MVPTRRAGWGRGERNVVVRELGPGGGIGGGGGSVLRFLGGGGEVGEGKEAAAEKGRRWRRRSATERDFEPSMEGARGRMRGKSRIYIF